MKFFQERLDRLSSGTSHLIAVADLRGCALGAIAPFRKNVVHIFQRKKSKNGSILPVIDFKMRYLTWIAPIPHRIAPIPHRIAPTHKNPRSAIV